MKFISLKGFTYILRLFLTRNKFPSFRFIAPVLYLLLLTAPTFGQIQVAPGVTYREIRREEIPWSIQVLEAPCKTPALKLAVELGGEHIIGIEPLNRLMERISTTGHPAVAGVNGDFFILKAGPFQGDPIGFCVANGELLSSPISRSALVILADGSLVIDRFHLNAYIRREDGTEHMLSGVNQHCRANGITLLTPRFNGTTRPQENSTVLLAGPLPYQLGPQGSYTLTVGEKHSGDRLFLVTVDGRQEGYSTGMSLPELAGLMKELGAEEALNLDGGGSTTMWVDGQIRNRPSDGRIRPIANALILFGTSY